MRCTSISPSVRSLRARFSLLLSGAHVLLLLSSGDTFSSPAPAKGSWKKGQLVLELRLPRTRYVSNEIVDVEITFRNKGKTAIKVPLIEGAGNVLFFEFLIVGDQGKQYLTRNGKGWSKPGPKRVKPIEIPGGSSHTVKVKGAFNLNNFDAGVFVNERYTVVAIYRDYVSRPLKDKKDPTMWGGIAFSAPATIDHITYVGE